MQCAAQTLQATISATAGCQCATELRRVGAQPATGLQDITRIPHLLSERQGKVQATWFTAAQPSSSLSAANALSTLHHVQRER